MEELLRFEPITPFTARITREDIEYRDVRFPAGTFLFAAAITANHDPGGFDILADRARERSLTSTCGTRATSMSLRESQELTMRGSSI